MKGDPRSGAWVSGWVGGSCPQQAGMCGRHRRLDSGKPGETPWGGTMDNERPEAEPRAMPALQWVRRREGQALAL